MSHFFSCCFQVPSLSFQSFIVSWYIYVFEFILEMCWAFWMCRFMTFTKFGKYLAIISSNILPDSLSLSLHLWLPCVCWYIWLWFPGSFRFCSFFHSFILPSLQAQQFYCPIFNSMIPSSICSICCWTSQEFSISVIVLPDPEFWFGSFL